MWDPEAKVDCDCYCLTEFYFWNKKCVVFFFFVLGNNFTNELLDFGFAVF